MKKIILPFIQSVVWIVLLTSKVFAVWPPMTSIDENENSEALASKSIQSTSEPLSQLIIKLNTQQQQLEQIVSRLAEDEKRLMAVVLQKETSQQSVIENNKESHNGHSVR